MLSTVARPVRPHWLLLFVLVAAGYVVGYKLSQHWFSAEDQGASFFPPAGVTLAALVLVARRRWPIVLAAAGLSELVLDLHSGTGLAPTLGLVVANVLEPLVGALLLTALVPFPDLRRTLDLAAFLLCAVIVAPIVGASIASTVWVALLDGGGWARFALEWWSGDGLGVLVVGSAILSLRPLPKPSGRRAVEALALAIPALASTAAVFVVGWFALVYVPVALLVVMAFRVGTAGVAVTGAAAAFIAAGSAAEAREFWNVLDVTPANRVLYLQLALAVIIAALLALAAEIAQRERMAAELARAESERESALELAGLYESERKARLRAQLLERNAARLVEAATVDDVARSTIEDIGLSGAAVAAVGVLEGSVVRVVATSGVPDTLEAGGRQVPVTGPGLMAEVVRTGETLALSSDEYDLRYPELTDRRELADARALVAVPLRGSRGQVIGVLGVSAIDDGVLDADRTTLVEAIALQSGPALERAQLQLETDRAAADAALLAHLGEVLERATTMAERSRALVDLLAGELDVLAVVHVPDGTAGLRVIASQRPLVQTETSDEILAKVAADAVAASGPVLVSLDGHRALSVALRARTRALGALTLVAPQGDPRVTTVLLLRLATRAALALDNAILYEQERDVSHSLQVSLLGGTPKATTDTDVATAYMPATTALEVGGDWYDVFELPDGTRAYVVGDVVGHGLEAAVAMGQLRAAVRALAPIGTPSELLANLDVFVHSVPEASMATLAYATLDSATGRVLYACAGHPPPLVVAPDEPPRLLWGGRSAPLGSSLGHARVHGEDVLDTDETLVLYTDGLVERRDLGLDDMLAALVSAAARLAGASSAAVVDGLLGELLPPTLADDVCVLALRRVAADAFVRAFRAAPSEIAELRHALESWLAERDVDERTQYDLVLAVSEAAANAAEHGYGFDGVGVGVVEVRESDSVLLATISDRGGWRPPSRHSDRGRGIRIMRALMEDVTIDADSNGTTVDMRVRAAGATT